MIRDDEPTIVVSVKEFSDWLYSRKEVPNDTNETV